MELGINPVWFRFVTSNPLASLAQIDEAGDMDLGMVLAGASPENP